MVQRYRTSPQSSLSLTFFCSGTQRPTFDLVVSISNFEHDGLGRYGDPIDPNGDLRAMSEMQTLVKPNGFLILGVPVALDAVVWNAHRLYGRVRLPLLLRGWSIDAFVGFDGQVPEPHANSTLFACLACHHFRQALGCVDGTAGWGDESMHAFRSPGTDIDCSNNQPVYVLRNARHSPTEL